MKALTKNFYLYGKENIFTANNLLGVYNQQNLQEFVKNMTIDNSVIYVSSKNFRNFNKTYSYKILSEEPSSKKSNSHHNSTDFNSVTIPGDNHLNHSTHINVNGNVYNETYFLNKKEKWYKTHYTYFKLDEEKLKNLLMRKIAVNMSYPSFNKKSSVQIDSNLCHKNIKKEDVYITN